MAYLLLGWDRMRKERTNRKNITNYEVVLNALDIKVSQSKEIEKVGQRNPNWR